MKNGFTRPVIIHRAILGSLERMFAILTEHTGGKWPFWLSPRQIKILPIGKGEREYADLIIDRLTLEGYNASVDLSGDKLDKMVRDAQLNSFNYIGVVGPDEVANKYIDLRDCITSKSIGKFTIEKLLELFKSHDPPKSKRRLDLEAKVGLKP